MKMLSRFSLVTITLLVVISIASCGSVPSAPTNARANTASQNELAAVTGKAQAQASQSAAAKTTGGAVVGEIEIRSFEMGFKPATINVDKPGRYTIKIINEGAILHDVAFPNGVKIVANGGETKTCEVEIPAEGITFICSVPGHEQAGMTGKITVGRAAADSQS